MGDASVFSTDQDSSVSAGDCRDDFLVEEEGQGVCGHRDEESVVFKEDVEDSFALPMPRVLCEGNRVVACDSVLG
jgi:hypothetical protein